MSHSIVINGVDADIELDSNLIWEDIEDAVNDAARDAVRDNAWDEVYSQVEDTIDQHVRSSDSVENDVVELLNDYIGIKARGQDACGTGEAFEKAVRAASRSSAEHDTNEQLAVQKRLADLEHKVNNVLDALFVLGNRAAAVDNREYIGPRS